WRTPIGLTSANYSAVTFTPAAGACPATARCETVTYFVPNIPLPGEILYTNQPDLYRRYQGMEMVLRKRLSHRWMMTGSVSFDDSPNFYASTASYNDPTNFAH